MNFTDFLAQGNGGTKNKYTQNEWRIMIGLQAHGASVGAIAQAMPNRTKLSIQTTLYNFTQKAKAGTLEDMVQAKAGCTIEECKTFAQAHVESLVATKD